MDKNRRDFIKLMGLGGGTFALGHLSSCKFREQEILKENLNPESEKLYEEIVNYPLDDNHHHVFFFDTAQTTPQDFALDVNLAAFPFRNGYFPSGVYQEWKTGSPQTKKRLNKQYNIDAIAAEVCYHFWESVFAKHLIKEMAQFLGCSPDVNEVIEARNERAKNYKKYANDLVRDVNLENVMNDTGYGARQEAQDLFDDAISPPAKIRRIFRLETIQRELFRQDASFEELESRFLKKIISCLDGKGNFGKESYVLKSYILPGIGLIKPIYDPKIAEKSWEEYKRTRQKKYTDRQESALRGKDLKQYLLTLGLEECLKRDMPMQFHVGDGEAPGVILRNQDPFFLEEVVRFDKDGVMRMPKVIPLHAGYPLVGRLAWLSHLYTNCYFEISIMNPYVHHGLFYRFMEIMEVVPISKILYASDAYNVPELYWLSGKWGKLYLSQALAVYVKNGLLTEEEALEAAKMILYKNNRRVYNLKD